MWIKHLASRGALSRRRAPPCRVEAVRSALVRDGVTSAVITSTAHGEVSLPVQTADNQAKSEERAAPFRNIVGLAKTGLSSCQTA
jgi:hypothetical protein